MAPPRNRAHLHAGVKGLEIPPHLRAQTGGFRYLMRCMSCGDFGGFASWPCVPNYCDACLRASSCVPFPSDDLPSVEDSIACQLLLRDLAQDPKDAKAEQLEARKHLLAELERIRKKIAEKAAHRRKLYNERRHRWRKKRKALADAAAALEKPRKAPKLRRERTHWHSGRPTEISGPIGGGRRRKTGE